MPSVLRRKPETFHAGAALRPGIVQAIKQQLALTGWRGRKIMLCFMCDPYPVGCDTSTTREVIQAIKASGNHVQILTKGDQNAQRDFDLLDDNDSFGVTWSGGEGQEQEPGAAPHRRRHENLIAAKRQGIGTWISCEPVIDPASILKAIEVLDCVDLWKIGKLNHRKSGLNWSAFGRSVKF